MLLPRYSALAGVYSRETAMFRHLSKVMLFLGIQAGLFWALQSYGVDQGQSHYETALAGESVEAQLATYVKSRVRPLWDTNPQVIDNALKAGEEHGLIAVLVDAFIAGPDNYLAAAYDKDRRLRTTPGERIILVGGSNVAFSMDSRILEERYGLAPVNMGLQAPLGVRFMTRHVAEYVRSGDVVVVLLGTSADVGGSLRPVQCAGEFLPRLSRACLAVPSGR